MSCSSEDMLVECDSAWISECEMTSVWFFAMYEDSSLSVKVRNTRTAITGSRYFISFFIQVAKNVKSALLLQKLCKTFYQKVHFAPNVGMA